MIIDADILAELCNFYQYSLTEQDYLFFAVRGSLPEAVLHGDFVEATKLKAYQTIRRTRVNYKTARCTIGLWDVKNSKLALFPGSTVPSKKYLFTHASSIATFNILCPGRYELRRGVHPRNEHGFQRHEAFLMDGYGLVEIPPVERLTHTVRFDWSQSVYTVVLAGDNLHAARTEPRQDQPDLAGSIMLKMNYSSSGCMTILGQPKEYVRSNRTYTAWNGWQTFVDLVNEVGADKKNFTFLLFTFSDFENKNQTSSGSLIRYGSQGPEVVQIQQKLTSIIRLSTGLPYYTGPINSLFSGHTAMSYVVFQEDYSNGKIAPEIQTCKFLSSTKHFHAS
ncbi:hypothetical protein Q0590_09485 [Rhodocytophaga aerolata]|uniref:Uncharacterized protein n=1 Tax=Rhodocytophaga aerolata TaxID=455078 RepID=A0ABT8R2Z3_9BACT|nr:hypothetical protein [Rhodocytophaga aerolata]MDO1446480.1 hypothetical protein [Rhodocytophaga aerolata]